ncbi:MAG: ABC transporter permease [Jiangellales bacterium]
MSDPTSLGGSSDRENVQHEFMRAGAEDIRLPYSSAEDGPEPVDEIGKPRSLWQDAWADLRRNKLFIVGSILVLVLIVMAAFPQLFTSVDPRDCSLSNSRLPPSGDAWFGYDLQGCDVYSRTIYGARASILVGIFTTTAVMIIGGVVGIVAGFFGGWADGIASRITDVFLALPLLLGSILILTAFPSDSDTPELVVIGKVVVALAILGWTQLARIMRSSVIQVKNQDYVQAARALGANSTRIIGRHVLPNSLAPVIVVAMISLGAYISAEATLSFLGIGLQPPVISWGIAINDAATYVRTTPHMLLFPAAFLSITVFAFIMLGDAVRDALDPKLR